MTAPQVLAAGDATATSVSVTFWVLAVVSVAAGLGMVLARRAVHSAVLLAVVMLSLAVLYAAAGAPFLAFVQIIVYTGAVLMLFLFVLMIVGVSSADSTRENIRGQRLAAGVAGIGLLVLLSLIVGHAAIGSAARAGAGYGSANLQSIARLVFTRYVYAFEVTSALLITAALGAMVLAHRERTTPKPAQAELARQRVASGHPTPLPGPGVYARHNAVDMPALLPDGTPSRLSVSPVIARASIERREPAGLVVRLTAGSGDDAAASGAGSDAHAETDSSLADSGSAPADSGPGPAGSGSAPADSGSGAAHPGSGAAHPGSGAAGNGRAGNGAGGEHEEGRS